jgi:hypothetical protein
MVLELAAKAKRKGFKVHVLEGSLSFLVSLNSRRVDAMEIKAILPSSAVKGRGPGGTVEVGLP